jgi:hypothetical protein
MHTGLGVGADVCVGEGCVLQQQSRPSIPVSMSIITESIYTKFVLHSTNHTYPQKISLN